MSDAADEMTALKARKNMTKLKVPHLKKVSVFQLFLFHILLFFVIIGP